MDQQRAFLEAIQEHPDDDLHRLAWADWLEEHGQDGRATFMRAQLQADRLDEADPARDEHEDTADDLLARHEREWAEGVARLAPEWRWRRGCIEHVTMTAETLIRHGDELFAAAPIRSVRLLFGEGQVAQLLECPWLGRIERLDLSRGPSSRYPATFLRDRPFQYLLNSPKWARLTELDLTGHAVEGPLISTLVDTGLFGRLRALDFSGNSGLGDRAVRLLAGSRSPSLQRLGLEDTNMTDHGLRSVLGSNRLPALRRLDVNFAQLFQRGGHAEVLRQDLLESPLAGQLTSLTLHGVALDALAVRVLAESPVAPRLTELRLSHCGMGEPHIQALAKTENLAGLRCLDLSLNNLRDRGARALGSSPHLGGLTHLNLAGNGIGGPGNRAILDAFGNLVDLDLSENHVGTPGSKLLGRNERPRRLKRLRLEAANLDDESVSALMRTGALSRLRILDLSRNRLGEESVRILAGSRQLSRLEVLALEPCEITSAGAQALLGSAHLGRLRCLRAVAPGLTADESQQLQARFGPLAAVPF